MKVDMKVGITTMQTSCKRTEREGERRRDMELPMFKQNFMQLYYTKDFRGAAPVLTTHISPVLSFQVSFDRTHLSTLPASHPSFSTHCTNSPEKETESQLWWLCKQHEMVDRLSTEKPPAGMSFIYTLVETATTLTLVG